MISRSLLIAILVPFTLLTVVALWQHGLTGIVQAATHNTAALQIFADLVIALVLFLIWMWPDARARGRNPWIWLALTLGLGSFGPLLYLLTQRVRPEAMASDRAR